MSTSHYLTVRDQLVADIRSALGDPGAEVHFGPPRREIRSVPYAVVNTKRTREFSGARVVTESFEFEIALRLAVPDPYPEYGVEQTLMVAADSLIALLAPSSTTGVPASAGSYASVSNQREVTGVLVPDADDSDGFVEVQVTFLLETTVYQ